MIWSCYLYLFSDEKDFLIHNNVSFLESIIWLYRFSFKEHYSREFKLTPYEIGNRILNLISNFYVVQSKNFLSILLSSVN